MTLSDRREQGRFGLGVLVGAFVLALATALVLELWVERNEALWLDEAWTVAIAAQGSWTAFFHQVYWDVNAPLYYLLMHVWQGLFGLSDLSWRAPSLLFAVATPLTVALTRPGGLPAADRLTWAAILALWFPGLSFAQEARCYAMLLFISTLQCIAFIRLLQAPSTVRASLWAALAALSILTHYDALFPAAFQGVVYLGLYRMQAVRTWPAALAFAPAFAWMGFHLPRIVQFARPDIAWYAPLRRSDLWDVFGFMAGRRDELWGLLLVAAGALGLRFAGARAPRPQSLGRHVWLAALPSYLGAATLIVIGFFKPSFAYRYLTPEAPGVLLGLVLTTRWLVGGRVTPVFVELILTFLVVGGWRTLAGDRMAPRQYNWEVASRLLERTHPQHLVFLWDHPVDPILHPEQLLAAGDAFFARDGMKLSVDPVVLKQGEDPNRRLITGAASPHSVILWVYDTMVKGTFARRYPPTIPVIDPTWTCRQFGQGRFGVYACRRSAGA